MSLYRQYRPQSFSELRGQEHIQKTLKQAVAGGRTSHAYLFAGPRGIGKTTTARILAKALNCENLKSGDPCNTCESCRSITEGRALDLVEIDAASNRGIDEIRELRENVRFGPSSARRKIFIIDEVHMLTKEAFNALLKTLEEPPAHAVFILATTEPHKVPATVLSRCQRFDFGRVGVPDLVKRLREIADQEKITVEDNVLEVIAEQADGAFRDAISLLDQLAVGSGGSIDLATVRVLLSFSAREAAEGLYGAIADRDLQRGMRTLGTYLEEGGDTGQLFRELLRFGRVLLRYKIEQKAALDIFGAGREQAIQALAPRFSLEELIELVRAWQEASEHRQDLIPGLWIELVLLRYVPEEPSEPAPDPKPHSADPPVSDIRIEDSSQPAKPKRRGGLTTESLREQWPTVLEKIKPYNHSVAAFLQVAAPEKVEGDLVTLAFPYKFHRERISDLKNRQLVERVISEMSGGTYQVTCVLRERSPDQAGKPGDDLVEAALEILGGEVVG